MNKKFFVHACYCVDALRLRGVHTSGHAVVYITSQVLYTKEPQIENFPYAEHVTCA